MAAATPSYEPDTATSGDTIAWLKSLSDYSPTDGWTLSYAFRAEDGSALVNVTGITSGSDYAVTIPAASSTTMKPGRWIWNAYVTSGSLRYTVSAGAITITPNLSNINYTSDLRSSAKKAYDNALAAWETFAVSKSVTLNGRTYTARDTSDLVLYVDRCRADYQREIDAEKFAQTGVNPRHIGVRFTRV